MSLGKLVRDKFKALSSHSFISAHIPKSHASAKPLHTANLFKCIVCGKHPTGGKKENKKNAVYVKCPNVHCKNPIQVACRTCMKGKMCSAHCRACELHIPEEIDPKDLVTREPDEEEEDEEKKQQKIVAPQKRSKKPHKCPTCHIILFGESENSIVHHITSSCTHHLIHCPNVIYGCDELVHRSPGYHEGCVHAPK